MPVCADLQEKMSNSISWQVRFKKDSKYVDLRGILLKFDILTMSAQLKFRLAKHLADMFTCKYNQAPYFVNTFFVLGLFYKKQNKTKQNKKTKQNEKKNSKFYP